MCIIEGTAPNFTSYTQETTLVHKQNPEDFH